MKSNKMLAGFGLLTTAGPSVVLAQVINRPSNERPGAEASGSNTTYIVIAVVVVIALTAFFFFRSKGKS